MENLEDYSTKPLGFFAREERSLLRGEFISIDERLQPREGEIWRHKSGGPDSPMTYWKIVTMAYDCNNPKVIYNQCDKNGIFISIRFNKEDGSEGFMNQPFCSSLEEFLYLHERYKTTIISI